MKWYCPNCVNEDASGYTHCLDCGTELTTEKPVAPPPQEPETALAGVFYMPLDADIAKGILDAEDIPCILCDDNTIAANNLLGMALGGIKLLVHRDNLDFAVQLLRERHPASFRDQ